MTPLDPQFNVENTFNLPATYFSPLTSPALHAQNESNVFFSQHLQQQVVNANSPVEMDLETNHGAPQEVAKKARKTSTSKAPRKTNVRQSPITKPQRRKTASTTIANQVLNEAVESSSRTCSPNVAGLRREEIDDNSSVSPEALSDMPPPPLPPPKASKGKQAANGKQTSVSKPAPAPLALAAMPSPATPASLMKLPSSSPSSGSNAPKVAPSPNGHSGQPSSDPVDTMFQLPESVTNFSDDQFSSLGAPALSQPAAESSSAKTPFMQSMPSPAFGKSGSMSASQSPMLSPGSSTPTARRTPQLAPRGSKKRQGSVTASPALLPRISPSIKPLLPGSGESAAGDAASQLLTSKSNYQNILEGNKVPGVSYPSELSTNLTSKRTSHKIAEQGRRNRINSALQEIAALLPTSSRDGKGGEEVEKEARGAGTPGSKASTVEMAIEYIKQLKGEVAEAKKRAEEAERKLKEREGEGEKGEEKAVEAGSN